jgi:hypothetical protein
VPAGYRGVAFGPDKRAISRDGRSVALRATRGDGRRVAFVVDLSARRKYPDIDLSALAGGNSYVAISPLGHLVWIYQGDDTSYVFTREGGQLQHWTENHCPGHGDMTVDAAGVEWFVGVCKAAPYEAHVVERQLRTGRIVDLTQGLATVASHVSTRNTGLPGWAFVTFSADYGAAADGAHANPWGECDALKLDGSGELRRVAQTHSTETWYVAEAHCSPSPNGSRVVFASDWGQATGGGIAAYVVAVPW